MSYETNFDPNNVPKPNGSNITNEVLLFGKEIYSYVNPKYAKLVFKINSAGNLTVECSPSLTPGVMPPGCSEGNIPQGTKCFNYDNKIIYSISFDDCINIYNLSYNRRVETTDAVQQSLTLYRRSNRFNKKLTVGYVSDTNGTYVNMIFESTDPNGVTNKFKLPLKLSAFDMLAELFKTYANNYFVIQYFHALEKEKAEKKK